MLNNSDKQVVSKLLAEKLKEIQKTDSSLQTKAKAVLTYYKNHFKKSEDSYRKSSNASYYTGRFTTNNQLSAKEQYLGLKESRAGKDYIKSLHGLQSKIEAFMMEFLNRDATVYTIYYTDENNNTYRKTLTSQEEKALYSKTQIQTLFLSKAFIKKMRWDEEQTKKEQAFSKHFQDYIIQVEAIYDKLKKSNKSEIVQNYSTGIATEAFERHFQNIHKQNINSIKQNESLDLQEVEENLLRSLGYTPWWTKGDVGNFQIKHFSHKTKTLSSGSARSLEELLNFINIIANGTFLNDKDMIHRISQTISFGLLDSGFDKELVKTLKKILKNLSKSS